MGQENLMDRKDMEIGIKIMAKTEMIELSRKKKRKR
jgi:hypothetical protein